MIFLDTSAIYALADRADPNHEKAKALFMKALEQGFSFLIHSYIIVEATALIQHRLGISVAEKFLRESEGFQIHWVSPQDHVEAVQLWRRRSKRNLSLVDCVSFVVMRRLGIKEFLGFDDDFIREGFKLWKASTAGD